MPYNRFRPALKPAHWAALIGGAVAALSLPVLLDSVTPDMSTATEEVTFSADDGSWDVTLSGDDGSPLRCEQAELESLLTGYDCGGTTISGIVHATGDDPDHTLWRMMRASTGLPPNADEPVFREGALRAMADSYDPNSLGFSLVGTGEHEGKTAFVLVSGPEVDKYAEIVVASLGGNGAAEQDKPAEAA